MTNHVSVNPRDPSKPDAPASLTPSDAGSGSPNPQSAIRDPQLAGPQSAGSQLEGAQLAAIPQPHAPRSIVARLRAYRVLWTLAAIVFALDQATKIWIVNQVPFDPMHSHGIGSDIEVIRGFFYIIHVGNTGAAWSMFSGRSVTLAILAAGTLIAIYFWRHTLGLKHPLSQICFGLLCGGIVGNLIDRLVHKHVIDFIDLHFGNYVYPTFNVADSGICVGVVIYLWQSLRATAQPQK